MDCMKTRTLPFAAAALAVFLAPAENLWRSTPFYHGPAAYTDRIEDRVNLWPLLYHRAPATSVLWPLFAHVDESVSTHWLAPLYLWNGDFYSLPWCHVENGGARTDVLFCGLAGRKTEKDGRGANWIAPLYYWDDEAFITPLSYTSKRKSWVLPLYYQDGERVVSLFYYQKCGPGYGELQECLDTGRMPSKVTFSDYGYTNELGRTVVVRRPVCGRTARLKGSSLLDFAFKRTVEISDAAEGEHRELYALTRSESANVLPLLTGWRTRETSVFGHGDAAPRNRREETSLEVMGPLYTYEAWSDAAAKREKSRSRVLWWLWNRQAEDGTVSLDVFPGVTYDTRPDGYRKTSLLWRLFRYENDPEKGTALDLFFIPCMR